MLAALANGLASQSKRRVVGEMRERQVVHHRQVGQTDVLVSELREVVPVAVVDDVDRLGKRVPAAQGQSRLRKGLTHLHSDGERIRST